AAFCTAELGDDVLFRRGTLADDGTLAWDGDDQVAFAMPPDENAMYPKIAVDAHGVPFIAFMLYRGGFNTAPYDAVVTKAVDDSGTFAVAPGFPVTLVAHNTTVYPDPLPVALADGRVLLLYNRDVADDTYYGRMYDGAAFDDEERVTTSHANDALYNAVADGNDVHLAFASGDTIRYHKRDGRSGRWSDEEDVASGWQMSGHVGITLVQHGEVAVTWLDHGPEQVRVRVRDERGWGDAQVLADGDGEPLTDDKNKINLNALVDGDADVRTAVAFTTGSAAPFTVRFAAMPAR
ncbi:MAG TPA: hypothetical protein VGO62_16455, partial [Myxococcota bacterium]